MSDQMIQTRLNRGLWMRRSAGVYGLEDKGELQHLAAAVASLPGAVVSHEAAARLHSIECIPNRPLAVSVPSHTTHTFPGIVVHRTADLRPEHIISMKGLPVTSVLRTIVDLAAVLRPARLEAVLDEALAARRFSLEEITSLLEQIARRGKPGVAVLRELLGARGGQAVTASELERLALRVFRSGGLPEPASQYPAPWNPEEHVDFAFPDGRLIVEVDGRRWHSRDQDFEKDRRRDNAAVLAGWRVLRFTWGRLKTDPKGVSIDIEQVLAQG